jgi:hypothetical protein
LFRESFTELKEASEEVHGQKRHQLGAGYFWLADPPPRIRMTAMWICLSLSSALFPCSFDDIAHSGTQAHGAFIVGNIIMKLPQDAHTLLNAKIGSASWCGSTCGEGGPNFVQVDAYPFRLPRLIQV